jgi:hypothetical protein
MEALSGTSLGVFIGLTVVLGGGAGVLTGRAVAGTWRPVWQVLLACAGLGLADRFLVYALFDGPLFSAIGYLFDTAIITALALVAYRLAWVANMVRQYPWLYRRSSPWSYTGRGADDGPDGL